MYVQRGIKRVNDAGQASYGEADVATYCPGLPHCTPERRAEEEITDRQQGPRGRGDGKWQWERKGGRDG